VEDVGHSGFLEARFQKTVARQSAALAIGYEVIKLSEVVMGKRV